jgi:hypothetical protein
VLGIVAVITIGGGLLATLGAGPHVGPGQLASPPGLGLPADHAASALAPIAVAQQPPPDIVAALVVPAGSVVTAHKRPSASLGLYDGSITFSVPAPVARTAAFYTFELRHEGWHIADTVSGVSGGTNIYALHDSNDGYTWEVGVLIEGRHGAVTPALDGGGAPAETSSVELRVIERDDPS